MKKTPSLIPILLCTFLTFASAGAAVAAKIPDPPDVEARSYVVMDFASGEILASREPHQRVEPASITKVLLAYIVYDEVAKGRLSWDETALISEKAWRQGKDSSESRMFLDLGSRVKLGDLINGIVIQSGNDASVAMAEHVAGSEEAFATLMNQYAARLGMKNSNFTNAPGMPDPEHYTTAYDIALLGRALIRDFPDEYKRYSVREFTYNEIKQSNRNLLLGMDPGADGLKTGYTSAAGYCLLSSIKRDEQRLITAVMGTRSKRYRAQASLELMNWGFRFFDSVPLFGPQNPIAKVRVWKGVEPQLEVGAPTMNLLLARGAREKVKFKTEVDEPLLAPVALNQSVGTVSVMLDDKPIKQAPLIALKQIEAGSLFQRLSDQIRMWLSSN